MVLSNVPLHLLHEVPVVLPLSEEGVHQSLPLQAGRGRRHAPQLRISALADAKPSVAIPQKREILPSTSSSSSPIQKCHDLM